MEEEIEDALSDSDDADAHRDDDDWRRGGNGDCI